MEFKDKRFKHGMHKTRIYKIWRNMRRRCNSDTDKKNYHFYKEKGIKVCEEWQEFENFYNWAIENGYNDKLTIDRIDVNKNYEPANCRWATRLEQTRNRTISIKVIHNGEELPSKEFMEKANMSIGTFYQRLAKIRNGRNIIPSEELLNYLKDDNKIKVEFNSEIITLYKYSKIVGILYSTLYERAKKISKERIVFKPEELL